MWTLTVAWQQYELSQYIHEHKHIRILICIDRQIDREKDIRACRQIYTLTIHATQSTVPVTEITQRNGVCVRTLRYTSFAFLFTSTYVFKAGISLQKQKHALRFVRSIDWVSYWIYVLDWLLDAPLLSLIAYCFINKKKQNVFVVFDLIHINGECNENDLVWENLNEIDGNVQLKSRSNCSNDESKYSIACVFTIFACDGK